MTKKIANTSNVVTTVDFKAKKKAKEQPDRSPWPPNPMVYTTDENTVFFDSAFDSESKDFLLSMFAFSLRPPAGDFIWENDRAIVDVRGSNPIIRTMHGDIDLKDLIEMLADWKKKK